MDALFRKYYWLVKLVGIGAVAGIALAAGIKYFGTDTILAPSQGAIDYSKIEVKTSKQRSKVRARGGDRVAKTATAQTIVAGNLFCPTCLPVVADPTAVAGPVVPGEIKSRLPLMLLATMESDDPAYSMATILDVESNALSAYIAEDSIREGVTLTRVERGRVVFMNGQQAEYIEIGGAPPPVPIKATPSVATPKLPTNTNAIPGVDEHIRCSDENNCVVDRSFVNQILANPAALAKQARVVPAIRNGQTKGFKFYGIRPGSLPKALGIKNGDMVTSVNGHELTGLDQAMGLYNKLRNAGHLSVTIERKGQPVQKEIDIK